MARIVVVAVVVVVVRPRPCYICKGTHFRALLVEFSFCPMEILLEIETFVLGAAQHWRHGRVLAGC